MIRYTILAALASIVLAGCGADGPPDSKRSTGVSISGTAEIGVRGSL